MNPVISILTSLGLVLVMFLGIKWAWKAISFIFKQIASAFTKLSQMSRMLFVCLIIWLLIIFKFPLPNQLLEFVPFFVIVIAFLVAIVKDLTYEKKIKIKIPKFLKRKPKTS